MHGDALRALAGPSRRVGTCPTQTVRELEQPWMGGIREINICLTISPLLVYPSLKCSCCPILIPKSLFTSFVSPHPLLVCFLIFTTVHCFAYFPSLVSHTRSLFEEWRRVYTYPRKSVVQYLLVSTSGSIDLLSSHLHHI